MSYIEETRIALELLGSRLRLARLARNEPMALFAERIGVSVPTLRDMERGSPTVQIGFWLMAFWALGRLDEMTPLLAERESLIERARREREHPARRRASRRTRSA
ncbi:MAG: XRE family transcriptional regulator [Steroidobacteraceae bacterium]